MRRRAILAVASVTLVVAATVSAVALASSGATGTVVLRGNGDWPTFDPHVNTPGLMWYLPGAYDRLVMQWNGRIYPYLATSWKVTPRSVTLKMRKDAKCANGNQVTPSLVAKSFQRLFTVTPKASVNLTTLMGPGPYSMVANNKTWTVTLKTQTPFRGLLYALAQGETSVICPSGLANPTLLQTQMLGSGAYGLVSAVHADQVVLKKRSDWKWGPVINGHQMTSKDLVDTQIWKIVANDTTTANLALTGEMDVGRINGPDLARLQSDSNFKVQNVKLTFPLTVGMNLTPGHSTADLNLRKAMSALIVPKDLNAAYNVGLPLGSPLTSIVSPWLPCYDATTKAEYQKLFGGASKAQQILAQAGYTGFGSKLTAPDGSRVTIKIVETSNLAGNAGEYLLNALKPLGADVQLTNAISSIAGPLIRTGQFDISTPTVAGFAPDPSTANWGAYVGKQVPDGGLNFYGPSPTQDPEWTRLVRLSLQRTNGAGGCRYWKQLQQYALSHAIILPIATSSWFRFARKGLDVNTGGYLFEPITVLPGAAPWAAAR